MRLGATLVGLVALTVTLVVVAATGGSMPHGLAWGLAGMAGLVTIGVVWTAVTRRRDDASLTDALSVLRGAATRDALTRSLNRVGILDAVGRRIAATQPGRIGVLTLDLDRLATVNQMLGHDRGDTLLIEIADRLVATAGADADVGRLGADVFAVVLDDATDQRIHELASALVRAVNRPVRLGEIDVAISATIGSATTDDADTAEDLLRASGLALEDAKRTTRHRLRPYTRELSVNAAERVRLIEELRTAKAEGEFEVYFQPVVALGDGHIVGAEALLRWNHPTRGIVDAALWVDLASEIGLLPSLGLTTIEECCRHFAAINAARPDRPLSVAVNLSPAELLAPGLIDHVRGTLAGTHFDPTRLVLEVSEASVADRPIAAVIAELRELGVRIAIDDFGTGSSSLEAMRTLGVDQVKIDRTFVEELGSEPIDTAIVRTVIDLATVLGLEVVAEGVTSEAQVEHLREMGGDLGQGFLYGRALPFTRFMSAVDRIDATRTSAEEEADDGEAEPEADDRGHRGLIEGAAAAGAAGESTDAVGELG
jgi:diguanylate cyclase (GGDEF)-like protein